MNTYARMKDPQATGNAGRKYRNSNNGNSVWKIALPIIGIVFLVCGSCLLRVYFKAKTESLTRQTAILENLIKTQKQELACLRNREAQFTTRSHVMGKLRHAGLRAPEYGQVTRVALVPVPGTSPVNRRSVYAESTRKRDDAQRVAAHYSRSAGR